MKVLISGQAGVAVHVQGDSVTAFEVDNPETERVLPYTCLHYLLADADDVYQAQVTSREEVLSKLDLAWRCDRALQLALVLLDLRQDAEVRREAAACVDELLNDQCVSDFVTGRLYSSPLPADADLVGAKREAKPGSKASDLLEALGTHQALIRRYRAAWDSVPFVLFRDEGARQEFEMALVASGVFKILAEAGASPNRFSSARIEAQINLASLPNSRRIFEAWLRDLAPAPSKLVEDNIRKLARRTSPDEEEAPEPEGDGLAGHEAYVNVQKQKQAIIDLMAKGDWQHARKYTEELIRGQIDRGGPEFAAKSLCDLAQKAKGFCNCSLQLELAQKAIVVSPTDGWAHGQVADAHFCLGRYDEALSHFEQAARLGQRAFAASGRARVLRGQSRLDESLAAYEQAISDFPTEMSAWVGRAEVLREMWRLDDALSSYREATERFPEEVVPKCGMAAVLSDLGKFSEAIDAYALCLEQHGDDVVPWCGQAEVLRQMGHLDEALEAYEEASRRFPLDVVPKTGRAQVLKDKGRLGEALSEYEVVSRLFPHEVVPVNGVAEVLRKMGRLPESLEAYSKATARFPHDAVSKCGRANVLKHMERFDDALQAYDGIVAEFPYNVFAWSARADLLKELGHLHSAIEAYDKVIERPWNPKKQGAQVAKAAIFAAMGRWGDAERLLPKGEPRTRDDWIALHVRGMILLRSGRLSDSVALFEKALNEIPFANERKYFESALVVANLRLKRFGEAVRALGQDQSPLMNVLRIHAFGAAKRIEDARAAYDSSEGHGPPALVELRNALAVQFGLRSGARRRGWTWFFEQECRAILLTAA